MVELLGKDVKAGIIKYVLDFHDNARFAWQEYKYLTETHSITVQQD